MISAEIIDEAAKLLGVRVLDSVSQGRQALLLTNQSYLPRFVLGTVNRDVNTKWVTKMKQELKRLIFARERTTLVACIDVRDLQRIMEEQAGPQEVKAIIIDGQHRFVAMKELLEEHPTMQYEFWLQLYIVSSEMEIEQLLEDMDRRLAMTAKDKKTIQDRRVFAEIFLSMVDKSHHHRRCINGTIQHKILRDEMVMKALEKITTDQLRQKIGAAAEQWKTIYEQSKPKPTSVLFKVIEETRLYQLVQWESGEWIRTMLR